MTMRILVVDDHILFRDGIVSLLKAAGKMVVGEAKNGVEAIEQAKELHPDIILLDIDMPQMNGLETLKKLRQIIPAAKVVMLTVSNENANLLEAVRTGASGYLLKNLSSDEFLRKLDGLERDEVAMTHKTMTQLVNAFADLEQQESKFDIKGRLTDREIELLHFVVKGCSNREIAEQLFISKNTVKYHMKNILQKLNLQNRAEAAAFAVRNGLVKEE
ncbi:MAG: response regulator transcription factor [Chloroflexota bacterium]